jgi:antitoxin component of RelBE/YafQ-DinJ toxin-antitoxin module
VTEYFSLRLSKELKEAFDKFCRKKGISASKAVNLYANRFIRDGASPYPFGQVDMDESTDYVIVGLRMLVEVRQAFAEVCNKYGMPMSIFVRGFMQECVTRGEFPFNIGV